MNEQGVDTVRFYPPKEIGYNLGMGAVVIVELSKQRRASARKRVAGLESHALTA